MSSYPVDVFGCNDCIMSDISLLQQGVLVRQLQDQHYHQYMQQLLQQQTSRPEPESEENEVEVEAPVLANGTLHNSQPDSEEDDDEKSQNMII
ncbi:hypothetical protein J6590_024563 [Homalodisca vitripennis]|nr:hypothetical protein J6590_024563 [Homalodisca vitripennis]